MKTGDTVKVRLGKKAVFKGVVVDIRDDHKAILDVTFPDGRMRRVIRSVRLLEVLDE